jgi:exodeoxyribonuclease V gamma subunit
LTTVLPEAEASLRMVTLDGLLGFFRHPTRWLLRERLGIRLDEGEAALETREPFVLDGLATNGLLQHMLELHRDGRTLTEIQAVARGNGALPHGQVGDCVFSAAQERVSRFAGRLGRVLPRRESPIRDVDLTVDGFRLTGRLTGMTLTGRVGYRLASIKANDYLNLWLHHLALNTMPEGAALQSHWIAEDKDVILQPLADAPAQLRVLLELYWQGTRQLLHFFPKSALAYIELLRKGKTEEEALRAANRQWQGDDFQHTHPESADVYYRLAFQETDPLDAEFVALAEIVFGPIFNAIKAAE